MNDEAFIQSIKSKLILFGAGLDFDEQLNSGFRIFTGGQSGTLSYTDHTHFTGMPEGGRIKFISFAACGKGGSGGASTTLSARGGGQGAASIFVFGFYVGDATILDYDVSSVLSSYTSIDPVGTSIDLDWGGSDYVFRSHVLGSEDHLNIRSRKWEFIIGARGAPGNSENPGSYIDNEIVYCQGGGSVRQLGSSPPSAIYFSGGGGACGLGNGGGGGGGLLAPVDLPAYGIGYGWGACGCLYQNSTTPIPGGDGVFLLAYYW